MRKRLAGLISIILITAEAVSNMALPAFASEDESIVEEMMDEDSLEEEVFDAEEEVMDDTSEPSDELQEEGEDGSASVMANGIEDFPESYRSALDALIKTYPNWRFVRKNIPISWSEAVSAQNSSDRSWIDGSANPSYINKSASKGGIWYLATKAGVEHYMDPRNYLDSTHIFAFEALDYDSSFQTEEVTSSLLKSTFMNGNIPGTGQTYANAFVQIGSMSDILTSPLFLAARVKQEQGAGSSDMISGTYAGYTGYYNYFDIGATGTGDTALKNGLEYAKKAGWDSRYKSLLGGGKYIAEKYISKGQNTLYFQKFNVVKTPYYGNQYMQNIRAPFSEAATLSAAYKAAGITDKAFVFTIPVYENMPSAPDTESEDEKTADSFALSKSRVTLKSGETTRLMLSYKPFDAGILMSSLSFTSDNPELVKVDENGYVTALSPTGETPVVVTVSQAGVGKAAARCEVSVNDIRVGFYDSDGRLVSENSAAFGDRLVDRFYPGSTAMNVPATVSGMVFAGWFTKPGGKGIRLSADFRITDDTEVYPCYKAVPKSGLFVMPIGDYVYTGDAIRPAVDVYYNGKRLTYGTDYKLLYKNNRKPGMGSIVINGKKSFGSKETVSFVILQAEADYDYVSIQDSVGVSKGKVALLNPRLTYMGKPLRKGRDYELTYPLGAGAYEAVGLYPVKITMKGNFKGELVAYESLKKAKEKSSAYRIPIRGAQISGIGDIICDAKAPSGFLRPAGIKVADKNGRKLRLNKDYIISFKNDSYPGKAVVTIRGIGAYKGVINRSYKIK